MLSIMWILFTALNNKYVGDFYAYPKATSILVQLMHDE
jgi:hypothetical protein